METNCKSNKDDIDGNNQNKSTIAATKTIDSLEQGKSSLIEKNIKKEKLEFGKN